MVGTDAVSVAEVLDDVYPDVGQQGANARLIASAPALLAALETTAKMWHAYVTPDNYDGHATKAYSDAVDAIRKATTTGDAK